MKRTTLLQTPPLSLYIHIPWCVRKCPYCDFNSHEANDSMDEAAYAAALMADLDQEIERGSPRAIQSIFFGGGTPSLLSADCIDTIIRGVSERLMLGADIEITLEANPGTFEHQKFADYRSAGINRLSIGVQSFNDEHLKSLGRIHDHREGIKAIEAAYAGGFDNINLDLMFGLPAQRVEQAVADITLACEFQPAHISHYQLTIEPNTYFHKHQPALPTADAAWDMQQHCHDILAQHQYGRYEVSAFARDNKQCRHNLNYWQFGDYIGIGAGAHGKITGFDDQSIQRRWKHRQPAAYMKQAFLGDACSGTSRLERPDVIFEFLMNALRLRRGFTFDLFEQRTGISREELLLACSTIDKELLAVSEEGINTTQRGYDFLNHVLESLVPERKR